MLAKKRNYIRENLVIGYSVAFWLKRIPLWGLIGRRYLLIYLMEIAVTKSGLPFPNSPVFSFLLLQKIIHVALSSGRASLS